MKRGPRAKQASLNGRNLSDCEVGVNGPHNHEGGLTEDEVVYHRLAQVFNAIRPAYAGRSRCWGYLHWFQEQQEGCLPPHSCWPLRS